MATMNSANFDPVTGVDPVIIYSNGPYYGKTNAY